VVNALVSDIVDMLDSAGSSRVVLGLAGPPAAGKSTLAKALVAAVCGRFGDSFAAYLPMDGFHLSNTQLRRLGRQDRKGAPDTFDVWGYVALLRRIIDSTDFDVYVPDYDRTLHEPICARLVVRTVTRLVVTEGNYLGLDQPGWSAAKALLNQLWYVDAPDKLREERLVARQLAGGRSFQDAHDWVARSDRANGDVIKATLISSDRVVNSLDYPIG
jgi:pantothenate kinase